MTARPTKLATRAQKLYSLNNQLQMQLRVLEQAPAGFDVQVRAHAATSRMDEDADSMAFLILVRTSKSAHEDLKAIMAQVKAIATAKNEWRDAARPLLPDEFDFEGIVQLLATLYAKHLQVEARDLQDRRDSLSEMGEMDSLRLQMAMDRLNKFMSTLSNLLKKASETASHVTQNLK